MCKVSAVFLFLIFLVGIADAQIKTIDKGTLNLYAKEAKLKEEKEKQILDEAITTLFPDADKGKKQVGRYQISVSDTLVVLVDTMNGRTWGLWRETVAGKTYMGWQELKYYTFTEIEED